MPTSGLIISGLSKPSLCDFRFSHKHFFKLHLHCIYQTLLSKTTYNSKNTFFLSKKKKRLSSDELYLSHTPLYRVVFSAFNPSKCTHTHTHTHTHMEQWAADTAAPVEQLGVRCLAQGSHLSRGRFLPEPRFELTTSGYKSDALSIRATTARHIRCVPWELNPQLRC